MNGVYYDGSNLGGDWTGFINSPAGGGYISSYTDVHPGGTDPNLITHDEYPSGTNYEVIGRALIFLNLPQIKRSISPNDALDFQIATGPASATQFYGWGAGLSIYKGHTEFPAADALPDWTFAPLAQNGVSSDGAPESALPACLSSFSVDLTTLQITAEKTEQP